jgi:predicted O-methyltransferase YrrM
MTEHKCEINAELYDYMVDHSLREPEIARKLRKETKTLHGGHIMSTPEQSQFLKTLVQIKQAKNIVEIGTFTGYATMWMAWGMPKGGHIHTINVQDMHIERCHSYWSEAGVDESITLHIADAREKLIEMTSTPEFQCTQDLVFIDADKSSYQIYLEHAYTMLKSGGLAIIDNVFLKGHVATDYNKHKFYQHVRDFNTNLHADQRFDISIVPIGDGMTLAIKR